MRDKTNCLILLFQQQQQQQPISSNQMLAKKFHYNHSNTLEAFAITLEWINETNLKRTIDLNLPLNNDLKLLDKIQKLLPTLSDLLIMVNNNATAGLNQSTLEIFKKYNVSFLEFIYWSLLHFDLSFQNQKINLSATCRRIGDEIFKCLNVSRSSTNKIPFSSNSSSNNIGEFNSLAYRYEMSANLANASDAVVVSAATNDSYRFNLYENKHARVLSCLIILKTLSQGRLLAL
jgi:hypothetical protein